MSKKRGSYQISWFLLFILYLIYTNKVNRHNTNILTSAIVNTTLNAHLNHVEYSTLARASPPIIAPHVGVIKFTRPLADTKVITVT